MGGEEEEEAMGREVVEVEVEVEEEAVGGTHGGGPVWGSGVLGAR